jgi:hypothetical protein
VEVVPVTVAGNVDAWPAVSDGAVSDPTVTVTRLRPRVIIAPGPQAEGALARHREFYVKPTHCLLQPDGRIVHRPELGVLSYRAQLGFIFAPTDRHTPSTEILGRVRGMVAAAEVVSIDRLEVGWEGTMWHIRYGEGGAFDGSCPVGPALARFDGTRNLGDALADIRLADGWGSCDIDQGAVAEFLGYVNRWIRLGPDVLVLAGAGHGPRLELDGHQPRVAFDASEPRVLPGQRITVEAGALGRIDVAVDRWES